MPRKAEPSRKSITRHYDAAGRRCKASDPGAVKRVEQTDTYYLSVGRQDVSLETTDLGEAWERAREILARRADEAAGRADPAKRPIAGHVEDWLAAVAAEGCSPKRVAMMRSRVLWLIGKAGWELAGDITRSSCQIALARLRREPTPRTGTDEAGGGRGRSAQTSNHYLSHARQFTRWLRREKRLKDDPLDGAKGVNVETDRRHDRRSPSDEEVRVLFDHLYGRLGSPKSRSGMSGERRALGYAVSMSSGLRAGELRGLTPESFDLEKGTVRAKARTAKNRRRTLQALPRWLCDSLAAWLSAGGGLWEAFPAGWPGRLLQADLAAARAAWIDASADDAERRRREASAVCVYEVKGEDGPLFWDFHALRHWYITQLASIDGIAPSTMQALARHSDPKLTLQTYAKAKGDGVRAAVDQVRVPGSAPDRPGE